MNSRNIAATIPRQGQWVNGPKEVSMARRRYQKGSLVPKTGVPRNGLWIGRWREDVIQSDRTIIRPYKWEVLGTIRDYPTRKLALRALEARLSTINSPTYRARPTATLAEFASRWDATSFPNTNPVRKARHEANCGSGSSRTWAVVRSRIWTARSCNGLFLAATAIPKQSAPSWPHSA